MLNQVILHCRFACQASPDDSDEHGTETKNEGAVSSTLRPRSEHFGNSAALKRSKLNTGAVRRRNSVSASCSDMETQELHVHSIRLFRETPCYSSCPGTRDASTSY